KTRVPAVDGWYRLTEDGGAVLTGTRCSSSGTYFFPPERVMSRAPGHADATLDEVDLSTSGTLWSFTDAQYQPPEPFIAVDDPYVPFCLAAVHLEREQIVVMGQVVAGVTVADLEVGMPMDLVADTLYEDDEHEYVMWKWRPATEATEAAS
ncbi:MAG: Zn-ribbon domain-containing OB-fold protein, partial [Actinomycetes bacterium]